MNTMPCYLQHCFPVHLITTLQQEKKWKQYWKKKQNTLKIYKDLSQLGALQENWAKGLGPSSNGKDEDNMCKKSKEMPSTYTKPG